MQLEGLMVTFKVTTWNLENLFRPEKDSDQPPYDQKLQQSASVILNLAPDVLAMQEIGSPESLADLQAVLQDQYPHQAISNFPDRRGIRVGYLSKLPIDESVDLYEFPKNGLASVPGIDSQGNPETVTNLSRGALQISVTPQPGFTIYLINAHLKSKLLSYPSNGKKARFVPENENERAILAGFALLKRTTEAIAIRVQANQILENNAKTALIVLGDLNDGPDAATTQILYGPGGSQPGSSGFDRADAGDDTRLFNLDALIPVDRRYSRIYQGSKELIDHILVSKELLPGTPVTLPQVDSYHETVPLPSIGDMPTVRSGKQTFPSDHAPISATFEFV
jgi:endonuclease/exonuclease/phosphatase family metal-dependent hydrolase